MKKEIQITTPTDWSAITLKKYLELQKDVQVYGEEESGYVATLLYHLCDVTPDLILKLPSDVLGQIKVDLASFMGETDLPLKRFVKINGVEYGFEPNLSTMEYGAYLDITRYETITIDDNWTKIMSVLYRPVKSKLGTTYEIETYNGYDNHEKFQEVGMDVHFGALFFFSSYLNGLSSRYPELYGEYGDVPSEHQIRFGKKWGSYQTIIQLAGNDITKFDTVIKKPLEECLLFLAYQTDNAHLQSMLQKDYMRNRQ